LIIGFQVTVENVGDAIFGTQCITVHILDNKAGQQRNKKWR